jgi:GNAT superfamily N-acetyltransferase
MPVIRPMTLDDVRPAMELTGATFDDLSRRMGEEPEPPPPDLEAAALRYRAFVTHDPEGSWVAEDEQGLAGCALAVKREGIWGLSLLIVRPGLQSAGVGSELLRRAHDYAHDAKGRIIMASPDPRAIRAYSRLGLELHPCFIGKGSPRGLSAPEGLRVGTAEDIPFVEEVDRFARGGGRRSSIETMLAMDQTLLVLPGRWYAFLGDEALRTMGALDDESAAAVLRGALARVKGEIRIGSLTAAQQWAVPVLLEAGLEVSGSRGPMFLSGDLGGFRPYLPSGAFL